MGSPSSRVNHLLALFASPASPVTWDNPLPLCQPPGHTYERILKSLPHKLFAGIMAEAPGRPSLNDYPCGSRRKPKVNRRVQANSSPLCSLKD